MTTFQVTGAVAGRAGRTPGVAGWLRRTDREREVLNELSRGATYGDIAATLVVSENTVTTHVSSLYAKLSAGRRSEALAAARRKRLL